jgi:hypothetical protein
MSDFGCSDSEKTLQAAAEYALSNVWMGKKSASVTMPYLLLLFILYRTNYSCRSLTLICIISFCISVLVRHLEICFVFSFIELS